MADTGYLYEKLSEAVRALATGLGPLRERMLDALGALITIGPSAFPEEFRRDFTDLIDRATAVKAEGAEGDFAATLARMSDDDVVGLANTIMRLEIQVRDLQLASLKEAERLAAFKE